MKPYYWIACVAGLALIAGCAAVKEDTKGFLGVSTKILEQGRPHATTKVFAMSHATCYARTKSALSAMHAYIYSQDKQETLIAVYATAQDTTPVGIFFKNIDAANTQVEVISPSSEEQGDFSEKLFKILSEPPLVPRLKERATPPDAAGP